MFFDQLDMSLATIDLRSAAVLLLRVAINHDPASFSLHSFASYWTGIDAIKPLSRDHT